LSERQTFKVVAERGEKKEKRKKAKRKGRTKK